MYELKRNGKVFTSKFVGTGASSLKKEFTGPRSHNVWETLVQTPLGAFRRLQLFKKSVSLGRKVTVPVADHILRYSTQI